MKKWIHRVLMALSVLVLVNGFFVARQQKLAEKMVRLHVVAASDQEIDQEIKLLVRDVVLQETGNLLEGEGDPRAALAQGLSSIETAANQCLQSLGCRETAKVTLQKELFPTREYDSFTLPAGTYTALRVTIGTGQGHNWWCVVFPSLCLSATSAEFEAAAQCAGMTEQEVAWITDTENSRLSFKSLELLYDLRQLFS
ncbi:stage II sporulation protein R [Candidatus Avoscillospira sp. LCP25S3_F1]|uniref:stage II sporulation protein R n=1 Tax=Candidatus Avoscillospira sp. LCP25S3_F1 TaxID=3438825 RepID=UPI003F91881A